MSSFIAAIRQRRLSVGSALLLGTLAVGTLDALDAIIFFGGRGVAPARIFQSIASGILGRPSFQGGPETAFLGLGLHYFNAFCIAGFFLLMSRRFRALVQRPVVTGIVYGLGVYCVMNYVVIPLSAVRPSKVVTAVFINGILIHAFGVGLSSALAAWTAVEPAPRTK